jgi:hypothetical protein
MSSACFKSCFLPFTDEKCRTKHSESGSDITLSPGAVSKKRLKFAKPWATIKKVKTGSWQ